MTTRVALVLALAIGLGGCGGDSLPRIVTGSPCVSCSMEIADLRFASARRVGGHWRQYDAIECLIHDAAGSPGGAAWLPDYDSRALHPADSLWIVKGGFPTPMSGGFAAFLSKRSAEDVAAKTGGTVDRFSAWMRKGWP